MMAPVRHGKKVNLAPASFNDASESWLILRDIRFITVGPRFISALGAYKTFFRSKFSAPTGLLLLALGVLPVTASLWL